MRLKGASQPHLYFCLHARVWQLYQCYSEQVEMKEITVKLLKILNELSGTQPIVKHSDFTSPCNINNFDGIENGGG